MLEITGTQEWRNMYPGAHIGLLELDGIQNSGTSAALETEKRAAEARLRQRYAAFTRPDLLALPVMAAYDRYYKQFKKTYHVLLQLESIVMKGKSLPQVSPLVDANFAAEVETLILTAGHDVARLVPPLLIDISRPGEELIQMSGERKALRPDDMVMRDVGDIACSIIYGQDNRSPVSTATTHVLYVAYAPPGIDPADVHTQLEAIERNVRLFAPHCTRIQQVILS